MRDYQPGRLDTHRLYVIENEAGLRLQTSTLSEPSRWDWPRLERLFSDAGYKSLTTERVDLGDDVVAVNVALP